MPDPERRPEPESRPTAWVLAAPGAGDNGQLRTLVDVLDADARWIGDVDPVSRVLSDRMTGFRASAIPRRKEALYAPPWPDLVLIAGGRAVIDACRIRNASGGRSRVVCLGRPWAPLNWFDLVLTTPQYRLPSAENIVRLDLPLNLPPRASAADLEHWNSEFENLPRPILGVLLGGDSGSYRFDAGSAEKLAQSVNAIFRKQAGSAVVVGSPRTPQKAIERLAKGLDIASRVYPWEAQAPNPYSSVLELADALLVTSDSASMLAEACYSGHPVAMFHLSERVRSRLNRKLRAMTPGLTRATDNLAARGLWVPGRDMRELHRQAGESGWLTDPLSDSGFLLSGPARTSTAEEPLSLVRRRVSEMLKP